MISVGDLNGFYHLVYQSNMADIAPPEIVPRLRDLTNANLIVWAGYVCGLTILGHRFNGTIVPLDDVRVRVQVDINPRHGAEGAVLFAPDGQPTKTPMTYTADLRYSERDGTVRLDGTMTRGQLYYEISIRRIGALA